MTITSDSLEKDLSHDALEDNQNTPAHESHGRTSIAARGLRWSSPQFRARLWISPTISSRCPRGGLPTLPRKPAIYGTDRTTDHNSGRRVARARRGFWKQRARHGTFRGHRERSGGVHRVSFRDDWMPVRLVGLKDRETGLRVHDPHDVFVAADRSHTGQWRVCGTLAPHLEDLLAGSR